jgi:hypothetical protein
MVVAPVLTLLAMAIVWRQSKTQGRSLISWVVGMALCWGLIATLWVEWIDYAKSYRSVFVSMQKALPASAATTCVASIALGESERAMLSYMLGINTRRQENGPIDGCTALLVNGTVHAPPSGFDADKWKLVWDGARPGDIREKLWLFTAVNAAVAHSH